MNIIDKTTELLHLPPKEVGKNRLASFIKDVAIAAKDKVVNFVKGFYQNAESVAVLTFASFGVSALLGELPFWVTLPWFIEAAMVIPIISVMTIITLLTIGEKRAKRRMAYA